MGQADSAENSCLQSWKVPRQDQGVRRHQWFSCRHKEGRNYRQLRPTRIIRESSNLHEGAMKEPELVGEHLLISLQCWMNEWMNLHPLPFFQRKVSGPYAETEIQGVKAVLLNIWRWCLSNPSYWKWWNLRVSRGNWVLPVFGSMAEKTRAKLNSSKWPVIR